MNIQLVRSSFYPFIGGTERQLQLLSQELLKMGVGIQVVASNRAGFGLKGFEKVGGIPVTRLFHFTKYDFMLRLFFYLLRHRQDYSIIHVHTLNYPAFIGVLAGRIAQKPVIVRETNCGEYSGRQAVYRAFGRNLGDFMFDQIRKQATVIAICRQIRDELLQHGFPPQQIVSIPNGVDTHKFQPASPKEKLRLRQLLNLPTSKRIVLRIGSLGPKKGMDILFAAWDRVCAVYPDAVLLSLGGDEGSLKRLRRSLANRYSTGNAIFMGNVDNIREFLNAADLFVLPSHSEGLSNALLEAMACGLPCVVSNVGGNVDLILHEKNGLIFESGDSVQLAELIIKLLNNNKLADEFGREARTKVVREYTLEMVAKQYVKLYTNLLKTQGKQG